MCVGKMTYRKDRNTHLVTEAIKHFLKCRDREAELAYFAALAWMAGRDGGNPEETLTRLWHRLYRLLENQSLSNRLREGAAVLEEKRELFEGELKEILG